MSFLELQDITKTFGGLIAVNRVSLSVNLGEILALIGPNGAGKTTIFSIITGFLAPNSGRVLFKDRNLVGLKPHEICQLGLVRTFQIVKPFSGLTVMKNVLIGALNRTPHVREAERRTRDIIELVGLSPMINGEAGALPLPLRKRLELARALATEPRLLLLDEVMAGLNATEADEMIALIKKIRHLGISIVLIEHIMRGVMALADRIVVLNFGEKIAEAPPEQVINNKEVIDAYLGKEFLCASG